MSVLPLADGLIYESPQASVYALTAVAAFLLYVFLLRHQKRVACQFVGDQLHKQLLRARITMNSWIRAGLISLVLLLCAIALMRPVWVKTVAETAESALASVDRVPHDILFILDDSRSMTVADTRSRHARFAVAKDSVEEALGHLAGQNIGLYTFTTDLNETVPATMDHLYLRMRLQELLPESDDTSGTDFQALLSSLTHKLKQLPKDKFVSVVILSDGEDNRWALLDAENQPLYLAAILEELDEWRLDKWQLHTVGVGSSEGARIPDYLFGGSEVRSALRETVLKALAKRGGGDYYYSNNYSGLQLGERLAKQFMNLPQEQSPMAAGRIETGGLVRRVHQQRHPLHSIPVTVAVLLLLLALVQPSTRSGPPGICL